MEEFYIDVDLGIGITQIQVNEVPPEHWRMPDTPQFLIDFFGNEGITTLTIQLEEGVWHDCKTRYTKEEYYLRYFELKPEEAWDPDYRSPVTKNDLQSIGIVISRYMIVYLNKYAGLFVPVFPNPVKN